MKAKIRLQEFYQALEPYRATQWRGRGSISFSVSEVLTISTDEFSITLDCIPIDRGECRFSWESFNYLLKTFRTFKDEWIEVKTSGTDFTIGTFTIPCLSQAEAAALEIIENQGSSAELLTLREGLKEQWDMWQHPEFLGALRVLGQSLVEASRALQAFGVTPDDLLQLVATKLGTDAVERLKERIRAVAQHNPWN